MPLVGRKIMRNMEREELVAVLGVKLSFKGQIFVDAIPFCLVKDIVAKINKIRAF